MESWNSAADRAAVFDAFAGVVKAMANPRRLELLEFIAQRECGVEELARSTGMGVSTASAHLQVLKRAGLVRTRREGTSIRYRLAGDDVAALYIAAKRVALHRSPELRVALDEQLGGADAPAVAATALTDSTVVVDVRPRDEYEAGHYPSAISIPADELPQRFRELPSGAEVVVYCRGALCGVAREVASWLRERGVDAAAMDEGVLDWRAKDGMALDVG